MRKTTFFERQHAARRATRLLLIAEVFFVIILSAGSYFLLALASYLIQLSLHSKGSNAPVSLSFPTFHFGIFAAVTLVTMIVILTPTYLRYREFKKGGVYIAKRLGCRRVYPSTDEPREKLLLNIVDEIAIAAGCPAPLLFVIQDDPSINAFAAGWQTDGAVVALSAGALTYLDRDELQGVVAHELSHVLNGDIRLNMALSAVVHGVNVFHLIATSFLRPDRDPQRSKEKGINDGVADHGNESLSFPLPLLIVGVLFYCYGIAGRIFATLLCAAVSRQRELLADASATQYTRNPDGIAGALKKIGGLSNEFQTSLHQLDSIGHFFIASYHSDLLTSLLATHPPLVDRIKLLDPHFVGNFVVPTPLNQYDGRHIQARFQLATTQDFSNRRFSMTRSDVVDSSGVVSAEALDLAAALINQIPQGLRLLASEPYGARAVVYSLMLSHSDEEKMLPQVDAIILHEVDQLIRDQTALAIRLIKRLDFAYYLPLLDLAIQSLHELSPEEYAHFQEVCERISARKNAPDDFDFAISALVERQLSQHHDLAGRSQQAAQDLPTAASFLLALIARCGADSEEGALAAYHSARNTLGIDRLQLHLPPRHTPLHAFNRFVQAVDAADHEFKRRFLTACGAAIEHDGFTSVKEWTMLQAIAQSIGVPLALKVPLLLQTEQ